MGVGERNSGILQPCSHRFGYQSGSGYHFHRRVLQQIPRAFAHSRAATEWKISLKNFQFLLKLVNVVEIVDLMRIIRGLCVRVKKIGEKRRRLGGVVVLHTTVR